jgi:signal recognition particle subunit SRP54
VVAAVENDENAAGVNKRRTIERGVFKELVRMLDPGKKPFCPVRGTSQVVMFVGLQGAGKTTSVAKCVLAPCPPPPARPQ